MDPITVVREGTGPEVLLVHGGASPATTWSGLESLKQRWTLALVHRRGYPPSPQPQGGRQDFELDARDLAPLLATRPHVVAHSYGVLGTLIAATAAPAHVRSLTLIEPPLFMLPEDPDVAHLQRLGDAALSEGLDADPAVLREFLRLAGASALDDGPLPEARVPALVASGGHHAGLERICDALARELDAQRLVAPGAGHFVARAPSFGEQLERFLAAA